MKRAMVACAFAMMVIGPAALAEEVVTRVESKMVCMINNASMPKEQIPVDVEGKRYYGCCAMCKERLEKDPSSRAAVDPVSGKPVDKATAVIGALPDGKVMYFENEKNLAAYNAGKRAKPNNSDKS